MEKPDEFLNKDKMEVEEETNETEVEPYDVNEETELQYQEGGIKCDEMLRGLLFHLKIVIDEKELDHYKLTNIIEAMKLVESYVSWIKEDE